MAKVDSVKKYCRKLQPPK